MPREPVVLERETTVNDSVVFGAVAPVFRNRVLMTRRDDRRPRIGGIRGFPIAADV